MSLLSYLPAVSHRIDSALPIVRVDQLRADREAVTFLVLDVERVTYLAVDRHFGRAVFLVHRVGVVSDASAHHPRMIQPGLFFG